MTNTVQITFQGMDSSPIIEEAVREKAKKLEQFHQSLQSVRVVITQPHKSHQTHNGYLVKVELVVPGDTLVVSREQPLDHPAEDVHHLIKDAFLAAQRMLRHAAEPHKGQARRHQAAQANRH